MRLIVPSPKGRGAGIGNELIPWGKALIAGTVLSGARVLHPAWGVNARGYRRYFGTSRFDWIAWRALLRAVPRYTLDEAAYREHGGGDFSQAVRSFAAQHGLERKRAWALEVEGLWGGVEIVSPVRKVLLAELLRTRWTAANLAAVDAAIPPDKLRIAMHVRRGDFAAPRAESEYRGRFNMALPMDWYVAIARACVEAFGDAAHFLVVSDAPPEALAPIAAIAPNLTTTAHQRMTDVSDLLALADSDFVVCSVSSYSLWAAAFGDARYAWYAPQLSPVGGYAGIWAHQPESTAATAAQELDRRAGARFRGVALGADGRLPDELLEDLRRTLELKRWASDLVRGGVVPAP